MTQPDIIQKLENIIGQINEREGDKGDLLLNLQEFRSADLAELFHRFKRGDQLAVFNSFDDRRAAEIMAELDDVIAIEILRHLSPERVASILNHLPPDEGADVIALSEEETQPEILTHLDEDLAVQIRDLSTYSPDTAGGLMTSHFVSVQSNEAVRAVLFKIKTMEEAETIQHIYVVDEQGKLEGVVSVRELLRADLHQRVSQLMERDVISVPIEMDQEDVTRTANKYHLSSIPVLDGEGILKGIVTFDDLMEVLEEESSEDMYRMAGETSLHPTQQPVLKRFLGRFPWLLVTLVGTLLAAGLIKIFDSAFSAGADLSSINSFGEFLSAAFGSIKDHWTFLLCFLPMIGGMAGNVGLQSSTVMVRGFATGEVEPALFLKILMKEVLVAAMIGLSSAVLITGTLALIFPDYAFVAFVVGLSLFSAILSAAVIGTLTPFFCLIVKVDPAYASGPLLTTLNDLFGFLIFFGIAYVLLYT